LFPGKIKSPFEGSLILLRVLPAVKQFFKFVRISFFPADFLYYLDAGRYSFVMDLLVEERNLCVKHEERLYLNIPSCQGKTTG
jgi:hypothetical protein